MCPCRLAPHLVLSALTKCFPPPLSFFPPTAFAPPNVQRNCVTVFSHTSTPCFLSIFLSSPFNFSTMLDIADFVTERGGDPNKIKESQRKRFAPESTVDEVTALYEEARRGIIGLGQRKRVGYTDISLIQHDMRWGKLVLSSMVSSKKSE